MQKKISAEQRFRKFVSADDKTDCHLWTGALNHAGYGVFNGDDRMVMAHRFSYEINVGIIPEGLVLDHLCRVRNCVNPAHLEPVTKCENTQRGFAPLFTRLRRMDRTHCPAGHAYSEENTYICPRKGTRVCRACKNVLQNIKYDKNRILKFRKGEIKKFRDFLNEMMAGKQSVYPQHALRTRLFGDYLYRTHYDDFAVALTQWQSGNFGPFAFEVTVPLNQNQH